MEIATTLKRLVRGLSVFCYLLESNSPYSLEYENISFILVLPTQMDPQDVYLCDCMEFQYLSHQQVLEAQAHRSLRYSHTQSRGCSTLCMQAAKAKVSLSFLYLLKVQTKFETFSFAG